MQRNYTEEIMSHKKAIEDEPDISSNYYSLAQIYNDIGEYSQAKEAFEKAIEVESKSIEFYNMEFGVDYTPDYHFLAMNHYFVGMMYDKMEEYSQAIVFYKKAIELEPNDAFYYKCVGGALFTVREYPQAIEFYKKAIELEPNNASYY